MVLQLVIYEVREIAYTYAYGALPTGYILYFTFWEYLQLLFHFILTVSLWDGIIIILALLLGKLRKTQVKVPAQGAKLEVAEPGDEPGDLVQRSPA